MALLQSGMPLAQSLSSLATVMGIFGMAACSATDEVSSTRVDHPTPSPTLLVSTAALSIDAGPPPVSMEDASIPEEIIKTVEDRFPRQPISKNVPDRECAKDEECGDGFCDRGYCAVIWRDSGHYGQRCSKSSQCDGICLEGRCRSCLFHAECVAKFNGWRAALCGGGERPMEHGCGFLMPREQYPTSEPDISPRKIVPKPAVP
jgi:hypothetical protein